MKFKIIKIIVIIIAIIIMITQFIKNFDTFFIDHNSEVERIYNNLVRIELNGIVEDVKKDTFNHYFKTIFIRKNNDRVKIPIDYDVSGLYNYLEKGDSIIKLEKSNELKVIRLDKDTIFVLDFNLVPRSLKNE